MCYFFIKKRSQAGGGETHRRCVWIKPKVNEPLSSRLTLYFFAHLTRFIDRELVLQTSLLPILTQILRCAAQERLVMKMKRSWGKCMIVLRFSAVIESCWPILSTTTMRWDQQRFPSRWLMFPNDCLRDWWKLRRKLQTLWAFALREFSFSHPKSSGYDRIKICSDFMVMNGRNWEWSAETNFHCQAHCLLAQKIYVFQEQNWAEEALRSSGANLWMEN